MNAVIPSKPPATRGAETGGDSRGLAATQALARADMAAVDALIRRRLASDVVLINQVAEYIIGAGGKRLRPMLLLLAAGATGGGKAIGADAHQLAAVIEFIHTATLLHDDVLDYASDATTMGKNLGDDLAEGKATLPLIHAIAGSDPATRALLRAAVEHGDTGALPRVLDAIHATGGLGYSRGRAMEYALAAEQAIDGLPDNAHATALRGLARYAVNRDH